MLFTGILEHNYGPPDTFNFDIYQDADPIKDDPRLEGYNIDRRVSPIFTWNKVLSHYNNYI